MKLKSLENVIYKSYLSPTALTWISAEINLNLQEQIDSLHFLDLLNFKILACCPAWSRS